MEALRRVLVARFNRIGGINWTHGASANYELKVLYKSHPQYFTKENNKLFVSLSEETTHAIIRSLLDSAIVIAGTDYALVLDLIGGTDKHPDFAKIYQNIQKDTVAARPEWWLEKLVKYIRNNSECVGEIRDGHVIWVEDTYYLKMSKKTLIEEYSRDTYNFEIIDNKIFYLTKKSELLTNLFYDCLEIAGSERRLAKVFALRYRDDKKEYYNQIQKHIASFRRFSFTSHKTFKRYVNLFTKYLNDNDHTLLGGLFSEHIED